MPSTPITPSTRPNMLVTPITTLMHHSPSTLPTPLAQAPPRSQPFTLPVPLTLVNPFALHSLPHHHTPSPCHPSCLSFLLISYLLYPSALPLPSPLPCSFYPIHNHLNQAIAQPIPSLTHTFTASFLHYHHYPCLQLLLLLSPSPYYCFTHHLCPHSYQPLPMLSSNYITIHLIQHHHFTLLLAQSRSNHNPGITINQTSIDHNHAGQPLVLY